MRIKDLNGKQVAILGFGREGKAMLEVIEKHTPHAAITVADRNLDPGAYHGTARLQTGEGWLENIGSDAVIIKSPGTPPAALPENLVGRITNSTQFFLDEAAARGSTVIGVTGTKGKSTTTSLIGAILAADGRKSSVLGNIGIPSISFIDDLTPETIVALEMSSYQLNDVRTSPPIAVITSLFTEHLDYHGSFEAYVAAKAHAVQYQGPEDIVFYNEDNPACAAIALQSPGIHAAYRAADAPVRIEETHLIGSHNLQNIAAAYAVGRHLGIADSVMIEAFRSFEGLPHRLQRVVPEDSIQWIDDAISTTPETAIAALDALGDAVETMILGGLDRGYDFTELARRISNSAVTTCILFPDTGRRIAEALQAYPHIETVNASDMIGAVRAARQYTAPGRICLLSPASPSYNMYKNFEERGSLFQEAIRTSARE